MMVSSTVEMLCHCGMGNISIKNCGSQAINNYQIDSQFDCTRIVTTKGGALSNLEQLISPALLERRKIQYSLLPTIFTCERELTNSF